MKMTFGKFKGTELKEISKSYLNWLLTLDNLQSDLRVEIEKLLEDKVEVVETKVEVEEEIAAKTILNFGQYQGLRIAEIESFNPSYLNFLISKNNYLTSKIKKARNELRELETSNNNAIEQFVSDFLTNEKIQFKIEDNKIVFNVPYVLRNVFRSYFKTNSTFSRTLKCWTVENNTRNLNKVLKAGIFFQVEKFEEYNTQQPKKISYKRNGFPDLNFDADYICDHSDDMDFFNTNSARKDLENRAIKNFLNNLAA